MSPLIKYRVLFVITIFLEWGAAGQISFQIPKEKIDRVTRQIDSFPYYLKAGKLKKYPVCQIKGHDNYFLVEGGVTLSQSVVGLPDSLKDLFIQMCALLQQASSLYDKKLYDSAFLGWKAGLAIAIAHNFKAEELHNFRVALNNNCFLVGDYTGAMQISREGLLSAESIGDRDRIAHFNNVIGYIHMKLGNFRKAQEYYTAYLNEARKMGDSALKAHALYSLADLAIAQKEYDKAVKLLTESRLLYRSIKIARLFNLRDREAYITNKMAEAYKLRGDLSQSLSFSLQSIKGIDEFGQLINEYDKASYYINTGDIYNRLQRPDSAIFYARKGLNIASRIVHREYERDAFEQMAIAFDEKKIYDSAFLYQKRFLQLKDSISNEINRQEIFQQDTDIQLEKQQQQQNIAIEKQKMWRNIIVGVALFLLLFLYFLYNRYRLRQRNKYQQGLNRQQNDLFNAIASAQEQERKRIAQDIHDGLGSVLSAAKLKMAEVKESKPELGADEKFIAGIGLIDEASSELRNISHNIMPATLSKLGLVPALKNLIEKISSGKGLQVTFIAHEMGHRLDEQKGISIYRIILELINNVVKHAHATKGAVQLVGYTDYINLTVEDNGCGFQAGSHEKGGIGLGNVAARVEYLKGKMDIDSAPGKGTTIIIEIPLP
ncbi:MAG TPA: sensor histidine kinase [Chitinophagaceae bacterium]|nr:sensor histidine kinase [Chitinophagaceae bacterium]